MILKFNPDILKIFAAIFIAALILIFLLGGGIATAGLIRYASANLSGFLPIMIKGSSSAPVTSSSALIVFSSTATTDGNAGGRTGMNQICLSQDPASHLCSLEEIETAWVNRGVIFQSPFVRAWVDNPILGSNWYYHSCTGWSYNGTVEYFGTWIDDNGQSVQVGDQYNLKAWCNEVHPVTCCKSAP
jgi:hypothetical protein